MKTSLHKQIIALAVTLVLVTTLVIQLTSWWSASEFNKRQIESRTSNAADVVVEFLSLREELLDTASNVLAADFGFKQAVATSDQATIVSALGNHGRRIDADLMILSDRQGELVADTKNQFENISLNRFLEGSENVTNEAHVITIAGQVYQLLVQPVKAPRTVGYIIVGFEIDQAIIERLKQLTGMEVTLARNSNPLLSTITGDDIDAGLSENTLSMTSVWERPRFSTAKINNSRLNSSQVEMFVSADLQPIYQEYDALAFKIITVAISSVLVAVIAAFIFSRSMIRPLARLGEMANRFARGDYQATPVSDSGSAEVQQLSAALMSMGSAVESREHKIRLQSEHDSLTGLMNQNKLKAALSQSFLRWQQSLQVGIYIDNFRQINDQLGPEFADKCLEEIAWRLLKILHPAESYHARFEGGEFFSVFQLTAETPAVNEILDQLEKQLTPSITVNNLQADLDFYFGITFYPQDGHTEDTIIRRTRLSADHARLHRLGMHVYEKGQDEQRLEAFATIDALNQALSTDNGELYLNFQPKVNLQTNQITSLETLIRWQRPDVGQVRPDIFVELAEQAGLITKLTRWVVDKALTQQSLWQSAGTPLHTAINVSAEDICQDNFCRFMVSAAQQHQISPKSCTIEITERDIMHDERKGLMALKQLREAGFRIALDDYGVGQSALAKLKELPVDEIKLDKSFIMKLNESGADQKIVSSTIKLAHSLGLNVVAEGIENEESLNLLLEYGCNTAQGYFISRPLPAAELENWLYHETHYHLPVIATGH